jgi:hypothetical protein
MRQYRACARHSLGAARRSMNSPQPSQDLARMWRGRRVRQAAMERALGIGRGTGSLYATRGVRPYHSPAMTLRSPLIECTSFSESPEVHEELPAHDKPRPKPSMPAPAAWQWPRPVARIVCGEVTGYLQHDRIFRTLLRAAASPCREPAGCSIGPERATSSRTAWRRAPAPASTAPAGYEQTPVLRPGWTGARRRRGPQACP